MEQFPQNNEQEQINFLICPGCGNKIRADKSNHENHLDGCDWRLKTNSKSGYDPMISKIKQRLYEEVRFSQRIKERVEKVRAQIESGEVTTQYKPVLPENTPAQEIKKKIKKPRKRRDPALITSKPLLPSKKTIALRGTALIPSSWGRSEEKTDKIRSVVKTPFESNRRKH